MSAWSIARYVVLGLSLLFSFVVLGLSAHLIQQSVTFLHVPAPVEILGLIVAGFSIAGLKTMLLVSLLRRNAFTSMIVTEVSVLSLLWVIWIALAAVATDVINFNFPLGCGAYIPFYMGLCTELTAVQGISFVTWLLLMCYSLAILIMAVVAQSRGNRVWMVPVSEVKFLVSGNSDKLSQASPAIAASTPQYQYPPAQIPSNITNYGIANAANFPPSSQPSHPMV